MTKLKSQIDKAITKLKILRNYLLKEIGGSIEYTIDFDAKVYRFRWKKFNIQTRKMMFFDYLFTFEEFDKVIDPIVLGNVFLREFRKYKFT